MEEMLQKRSRYAKIFDLGNGRRRAVISSGPVHYQDERGIWRDVETVISTDDAIQTNPFLRLGADLMVRLPRTTRGVAVVHDRRGHSLAYKPLDTAMVAGLVEGGRVRYPEAWPGTTLEFVVTPEGMQTLMHRDPATSPTTYRFRLTGNLVPIPDGRAIRWGDGLETHSMVTLPAWALNEQGEPVEVSQVLEEGILTVTCDPSATVVDPTTTIQPSSADAKIQSNAATSNYGTEPYVTTGYNASFGGVRFRSLVKFDLSGITGTVNSATLTGYVESSISTGSPSVAAYRVTQDWVETTVTWNTQPTYTATGASPVVTDAITSNTDWNFDVAAIVSEWITNGQPNYGFILVGTNEGGTTGYVSFNSREMGSFTPKLTIDYTEGGGGGGSARRRFATII